MNTRAAKITPSTPPAGAQLIGACGGLLQRKSEPAGSPGGIPSSVHEVLRTSGRALDRAARSYFEPRFGHDFGQVRIHADDKAAQAASSINARAFTVGRDVVFGRGQYAPATDAGLRLIAHELTHVVQQQGTPQAAVQRAAEAPKPPVNEDTEKEIPAVVAENIDLSALAAAVPEPAAAQPLPAAQKEAQPALTLAAQMAGQAPEPVADSVVPPHHASEREADAMSAWAAARNPLQARPAINRYAALRAPARKPAPPAPAPQGKPRRRLNLVFIMGADSRKSPNRFYTAAHAYFETRVPNDALIDDAQHRNLASVFDYLRTLNPREAAIGNLYLVSHANEDGTLSFPLTASEEDRKLGKAGFPQLRQALEKQPEMFALPPGLVDANSIIHIKGCNIGRSTEMLDQLDQAFGGKGSVTAPTHKQEYGYQKDRTGKVTEAHEAMAVYYLEFPGLARLTLAQQLARFREKYAFLSEKRWKTLLGKAGATRAVLTPLSMKYTAPAGSEQAALADSRAWGDPQLTRPEMYDWRIASQTKQKDGRILYVLEANKTNFTVDRVLTDEAGKRLEPAESERDFFGASDYEAPERKPKVSVIPAEMSMGAIFQGIADVSRRIRDLPVDDVEMHRDLEADWQALEDDLRKRPAKMGSAEIIRAISELAGAIATLAGKDAGIRSDLLAAGETCGEELLRRPQNLAGADLVTLIDQLSGAITGGASGDGQVMNNLIAAKSACEAELKQRNILVDVEVVKTEDWLGADEVYVRMAGAHHTETTPEVKLNDGEFHSFGLGAAPYLPLTAPLTLQVYDADWPDADDLIVRMEWKPPYAPAGNAESFDQADYRVRLHFDK